MSKQAIEAMRFALDALEDIFGKNKKDVGAINGLRAAIAQLEGQGWQPIESAPRDGTSVLIAGGVYWCKFLPFEFPTQPYKESTKAYFDWPTWVDGENYHQPTVWMPLPPAPDAAMEAKHE